MNILVADDDQGCVCLVQEVLEMIQDVHVITAFDGAEAWWWLTHPDLHYSVVILDVKMPKVDGFALVTACVRHRFSPHSRSSCAPA